MWRHKSIVRAAGVVLMLAMLAMAVSTTLIWRANQELSESLERERQFHEQERQTSYYQRIALAEREWSANNQGRMEQVLEECSGDLRGWEWHYLKRLPHKTLPPLQHDSMVTRVAFSPTGECFASATRDGVIKVWDAQTGHGLLNLWAHEKRVCGLAFSPDGRCLASASADKTVKVWDTRTGRQLTAWRAHHGIASVRWNLHNCLSSKG
jgi:WD40 repeat protein